jgi:hypothetical protein
MEDNVRMDLNETRYEAVEWIQLPHDQWRDLVNTVMNVRVQQSS